MKNILLIKFLLLSSITFHCIGQQSNFLVSYPSNFNSIANSVIVQNDTTYVLGVRSAIDNSLGYRLSLIKIDSIGDTLWAKQYVENNWNSLPVATSVTSGGFLLVGTSPLLNGGILCVRVDDNGNEVWTRRYSVGSGDVPSVIETTDGGFAISYGYYTISIIKLDSFGNFLWKTNRQGSSFGGGSFGYAHSTDITQTLDGGYAAVGNTSFNAFIFKTDSLGNFEWANTLGGNLPEYFRGVTSTLDGNIVAVGYTESFGEGAQDALLVKMDLNGNILWSKTYGTTSGDHFFEITQQSTGDLIVTGYKGSIFGVKYPIIFRTDNNGNLLSSFRLTTPGVLRDTKITLDGGLISVGYNNSDAFVLKSNLSGISGCGSVNYPMVENTQTLITVTSSIPVSHIYTEALETPYDSLLPLQVIRHCDAIVTYSNTFSTLNVTACNEYTSPSGSYTWLSTGTYLDTLVGANPFGYDSILTINLIINVKSTSTLNATACNEYLSPSNSSTWTSTGTYLDTLVGGNALGCDSIITVNLSINNSTSTFNVTACNEYTSPSGSYTWTTTGTYLDTLIGANALGCDSIITINLNLNKSTSTLNVTACNEYTSPSGSYTSTSTGTYLDTLVGANSLGCDSIITINLTLNESASIVNTTACDKYISPSGSYVWTSTGIYLDTLIGANALGCDSILTVNLIINSTDTATDTQIVCDSFTWINGITYTSNNNTAIDTIINILGCSSIVTLNLTICNCDTSLIIPNILTPNQDGLNDFFMPFVGANIISITTTIYNRWGALLFESNQINHGWNGMNTSGTEVPDGTYFYVIELEDKKDGNSNNKIYKGALTLIR
jgi:gliding motility-associated-like protein